CVRQGVAAGWALDSW
nr:immunoglobulin heavy chain junction region [Macaca mulatta]MOX94346.1 immunoglobulin heavy chain junction region [Macaca mulatta]MOX96073.1 immunoglobulin heavy chain junction region [Macaca mulatta]